MLEKSFWIFDLHDISDGGKLTDLKHNNQILYNDLLPQLIRGRTWVGLNFNEPTVPNVAKIPPDRDTYIFSWHLENIPFHFVDQFCLDHPNQQIIVVGEIVDNNRHPNLKMLQYHCWDHVITSMLSAYGQDTQFKNTRPQRLSSLVAKPSYYKTLITAYLHSKYKDRNDIMMSWNLVDRACDSMKFIAELKTVDKLAYLVDHYYRHLKNKSITISSDTTFSLADMPWEFWNFSGSVYDVWVNLTNETFSRDDGIFPGPYVSEKTWKALLAGTAIVPVGMSGIYKHFEKFGFQFDYGWSLDFDSIPQDLSRILGVFDVVDSILDKPIDELANAVRDACKYNYEYIRSSQFVNQIRNLNEQNLEEFLSTY